MIQKRAYSLEMDGKMLSEHYIRTLCRKCKICHDLQASERLSLKTSLTLNEIQLLFY